MERHGSQFMRKHEPKGKLRDCFPICFGAMEADESAMHSLLDREKTCYQEN